MDKRVKISDMLTKIEASPMHKIIRDMQSRNTLFDNPSFNLAREMQDRISAFESPMESITKSIFPDYSSSIHALNMQQLIDSTNMERTALSFVNGMIPRGTDWEKGVFAVAEAAAIASKLLPNIDRFNAITQVYQQSTFAASFVATSMKNFDSFKGMDLSKFDFSDEDEDILVEDYTLDIVPAAQKEKKIILLHEANRLQIAMEEIYRDNSKLYTLKPRHFEEMIAELLRYKNFEVELTKQTRDGGYDLIAVQNVAEFPLRFLVECKRFAAHKPVGIEIIRAFSHVVQTNHANKGILFTTSYISKDARQHAQNSMPYQLDFREKGDILEWIKNYLTLS